jgi:hypothetical protein
MGEEGFQPVKFLASVTSTVNHTPHCVLAAYARCRPQKWIRIKFDQAEIILCDSIDLALCRRYQRPLGEEVTGKYKKLHSERESSSAVFSTYY